MFFVGVQALMFSYSLRSLKDRNMLQNHVPFPWRTCSKSALNIFNPRPAATRSMWRKVSTQRMVWRQFWNGLRQSPSFLVENQVRLHNEWWGLKWLALCCMICHVNSKIIVWILSEGADQSCSEMVYPPFPCQKVYEAGPYVLLNFVRLIMSIHTVLPIISIIYLT